jgi:hypothetical protein
MNFGFNFVVNNRLMDPVPWSFMVSYGCALCTPKLSKFGYENKHLNIHYSPSLSS